MSKEPFHCGLWIAVPRREQSFLAADQRKTHRLELGERGLIEFRQHWFSCWALPFVSDLNLEAYVASSTCCVLREFCLVRLETFSEVLVKHDDVTIREDDWYVFLRHTLAHFSDGKGSEKLSGTYQV